MPAVARGLAASRSAAQRLIAACPVERPAPPLPSLSRRTWLADRAEILRAGRWGLDAIEPVREDRMRDVPALSHVRRFRDVPAGDPRSILLLLGGTGAGKTTATAWLAAEVGGSRPGLVRAGEPIEAFHGHRQVVAGTERLLRWAVEAPDRTFIAKRLPSGEWRRITYAHALDYARRIGQGLIDRGLSAERPLMILSENDLEHAMLALAALHAGVPFLAVSPAYSLISQDHSKLKFVANLMTPGLVFASDGMRYERAIAAAIPGESWDDASGRGSP